MAARFELEGFERVDATAERALLRVNARMGGNGGSPPALVVDDGQQLHRLTPLPSPPGEPGALRAAYSAPVALLAGRTAFALELASGEMVDLPAPARRRTAPGRRRAVEVPVAPQPRRRGAEPAAP